MTDERTVREPRTGLTFGDFAATNRARCEAQDGFGHPLSGWTLSDWLLAATGEFGEAANVAKKLNRERDGIPGNTKSAAELRADLADEFADAVIYLDLAAQSQGIDLGSAVASKFNRTSEKIGAPHRLAIEDEAAAGVGLDVERLLRIEAAAFAYREQFRRIKGVPLAVDLGEAIDEERDALFAALASGTVR
jgi:NTP pyrophosphatase (non-canonical NTP hydrolase)